MKNAMKNEKVVCPCCGGTKVLIGVLPKDNKLCPACFGEGEVNARRLKFKGEKLTVRPSKGYAV